jgi:hypothetical protein
VIVDAPSWAATARTIEIRFAGDGTIRERHRRLREALTIDSPFRRRIRAINAPD